MQSNKPLFLLTSESIAINLVVSLKEGNLSAIASILAEDPSLANVRLIETDDSRDSWRTPLHVITDWPGYFDNAPSIAKLLIEAGGDPNVDCGGSMPETALHHAASSDDVDVARVLIEGGADIERGGGSIGTPLANAIGYGCWSVASLLVARGALVSSLWEASALGMTDLLEELLEARSAAVNVHGISPKEAHIQEELDQALWHGCQGGHVRAVKLLLARGASLRGKPEYAGGQSHVDVAKSLGTQRELLVGLLESLH